MWGADKNAMIKVFDTVTNVVNHLIDYINTNLNKIDENSFNENINHIAPAKHITPNQIADVLGVKNEYDSLLKDVKNKINENFYKIYNKIL